MRQTAALAAVLGALSFGCPPSVKYPECRTDQECKEHTQVCITGFCKQCREDAQCKPGETCKDNGCVPKPECGKDQDCAAGLKCGAGKCVAECSEATAAQDCGAGRRCLSGRCAAEEDCSSDADCGEGKACVSGRCRAQGLANASQNARLGACELAPVFFDFDEATLSQPARDTLNSIWQCLQKESFRRLNLGGHTDERGTTEYNLALGSRRAEAVKKYLTGLGAEPKKLRTVSFGQERPRDPAHDETAWAKNRRVEVVPEQ